MTVVSRFGLSAELNPWIGWWIANFSFLGLWMVKLAIMSGVLVLNSRLPLSVLRGVVLGLAGIVALNFITLLSRV